MGNLPLVEDNSQHIVRTSQQWSEAAAAYRVIPNGILCVEVVNPNRVMIKIGDGCRYYADLPYIGGYIDLSNYYTKSETDLAIANAIFAMGHVLRFKGVKKTVKELPTVGNNIGDVWLIDDIEHQDVDKPHRVHEVIWIPEEKWYVMDGYGQGGGEGYVTEEEFESEVDRLDGRIDDLVSSAHVHLNKQILDDTTASYTTEQQQILYDLKEHAVTDYDKLRLFCDTLYD